METRGHHLRQKFSRGKQNTLHAVRNLFYSLGGFIFDHPLWFIWGSLCVGLACGLSFLFIGFETRADLLYALPASRARSDLAKQTALFGKPARVNMVFIVSDKNESILSPTVLRKVQRLDNYIKLNLTSKPIQIQNLGEQEFTYEDVCYRMTMAPVDFSAVSEGDTDSVTQTPCYTMTPLDLYKNERQFGLPIPTKTWPYIPNIPNNKIVKADLALTDPMIVKLNSGTTRLMNATGMLFLYHTKSDPPSMLARSLEWETALVNFVNDGLKPFAADNDKYSKHADKRKMEEALRNGWTDLDWGEFKVFVNAQRSWQDELSRSTSLDTRLMMDYIAAYMIIATYMLIFNHTNNLVRSKSICGVVGSLSALLGFVIGGGTCYWLGLKHTPTMHASPILVLAIGLDNTFVVMNFYTLGFTYLKNPKERCRLALCDSGIALFITTFTSIISFLVGAAGPYLAVRNFCLITAMGLAGGFVANIIFFYPFLCLEARAESEGRVLFMPRWLYKHVPASMLTEDTMVTLARTGSTETGGYTRPEYTRPEYTRPEYTRAEKDTEPSTNVDIAHYGPQIKITRHDPHRRRQANADDPFNTTSRAHRFWRNREQSRDGDMRLYADTRPDADRRTRGDAQLCGETRHVRHITDVGEFRRQTDGRRHDGDGRRQEGRRHLEANTTDIFSERDGRTSEEHIAATAADSLEHVDLESFGVAPKEVASTLLENRSLFDVASIQWKFRERKRQLAKEIRRRKMCQPISFDAAHLSLCTDLLQKLADHEYSVTDTPLSQVPPELLLPFWHVCDLITNLSDEPKGNVGRSSRGLTLSLLGPVWSRRWWQIVMAVIMCGYLVWALWGGVTRLSAGLDLENLTPPDSYLREAFALSHDKFPIFPYETNVLFTAPGILKLTNDSVSTALKSELLSTYAADSYGTRRAAELKPLKIDDISAHSGAGDGAQERMVPWLASLGEVPWWEPDTMQALIGLDEELRDLDETQDVLNGMLLFYADNAHKIFVDDTTSDQRRYLFHKQLYEWLGMGVVGRHVRNQFLFANPSPDDPKQLPQLMGFKLAIFNYNFLNSYAQSQYMTKIRGIGDGYTTDWVKIVPPPTPIVDSMEGESAVQRPFILPEAPRPDYGKIRAKSNRLSRAEDEDHTWFSSKPFMETFLFFESDTTILRSTVLNMATAFIAIILVSSLLMRGLGTAVLVTLVICAVDLGIFGAMGWWGIHLNILSMILLVLSIGFSVDYTVHVVHTFSHAVGKTRRDKTIETLVLMCNPVTHGAVSTALGILPIYFRKEFIMQTFFKMTLLVVAFGYLCGVVFLPSILSVCGPRIDTTERDSANLQKDLHKAILPLFVHTADDHKHINIP